MNLFHYNWNTPKEIEKYESPIYEGRRKCNTSLDEFLWQKTQFQQCSKCRENKSLIYFENNTCGNLPFHAGGHRYKRTDCIMCRKKILDGQKRAKKNTKKSGFPIKPPVAAICGICKKSGNHFGRKNEKLVFDHCHEKEIFRGWLCDSCNRSLGIFGDDIHGLLNVINYLYQHKKFNLKLDENSEYYVEDR